MNNYESKICTFILILTCCFNGNASSLENAELLAEKLKYREMVNEHIEFVVEFSARQVAPIIDDPKFLLFYKSKMREYLNQNLSWEMVRTDISSVIANVYTDEEIMAFIEFSLTPEGMSYFEKENQLKSELEKWFQSNNELNYEETKNKIDQILKEYGIKAKQAPNIDELKNDDYYNVYFDGCEWPIPKSFQLRAHQHSSHAFFDRNISPFSNYKEISFSDIEEPIEVTYEDKSKYELSHIETYSDYKLYKLFVTV